MVKTITHHVQLLTESTLKVARPMPLVILIIHLFFFAQIEKWVPVLAEMANRPQNFIMQMPQEPSYDFTFGHRFGAFSLKQLEQLNQETIKELILHGEKPVIQERMEPLIFDALKLAEFYELDPFWYLAIMKVESHFKNSARSIVNAQGLMQIMPTTADDIFRRMKREIEPELARKMMQDRKVNMELGAYYLKYLLRKFNYNYKHATIAYNMGPYWVIRRLRNGKPVGMKNFYWNKVNRAYRQLTRSYRKNLKSPRRVPSLITN